jgi:CheY-like chemotaxis protein
MTPKYKTAESINKEFLILIVDDKVAVIDSIKFALEQEGYTNIFTASDPQKAVEIIEQNQFDFISVDYSLTNNEINGIGLLKFVDDKLYKTKRLIYTSAVEIPSPDLEICKELGIEILAKSLSHAQLLEKIAFIKADQSLLPYNPKFANMTRDEFILFFAKELIDELESDKDALFWLGGDSIPIKKSELLTEIKNLTHIGLECVGNYLEAQCKIRLYLENKLEMLKR